MIDASAPQGRWRLDGKPSCETDAEHVGQGVEGLRFELPALAGGDGLRASVTSYPSGQ